MGHCDDRAGDVPRGGISDRPAIVTSESVVPARAASIVSACVLVLPIP